MRRLVSVLPAALLALLVAAPAGAQDLELGEQVYVKWCGHCHGDDGAGEGVAASRLKPRPRDFTSGKYKIRMTTTGNLPTDEDIRQAIRRGLYYSSMPAFPANYINDRELDAVVAYVKSFSEDFDNPELQDPETIVIPNPPAYDEEQATTVGRQVYEETGCARCHGNLGRGDGMSAPTLVDDWGNHIRVADLTMPWTFRGGGTREDIFRSMSTGFNGTPMPGFHNALGATPEESQERMWAIVDYMLSLSGGPSENGAEAPYANLLRSVGTEEALDLDRGEELFAGAPKAMFPFFGQIVEPGRNFYPSAIAITAQAVHNQDEIAFRLTWNDMRAETGGRNAPDLPVPEWDEQQGVAGAAPADAGEDEEGGFWGDEAGDEEEGDFWGDEATEEETDEGGDFWGEETADEEGGDDFWGEGEDDAGAAPATPETEFSDAVALQFPLRMPAGVRQPYFLFGDAQNPVDLWFVDLARPGEVTRYEGRGSTAIVPADGGEPIDVVTSYEEGQWSAIFKRKRRSRATLSFEENTFVPVAFTAWDGFNRERGNKRALTGWYNVYVEPLTKPSPVGPMLRAGLAVLGLEILFIAMVRRRNGKTPVETPDPEPEKS